MVIESAEPLRATKKIKRASNEAHQADLAEAN
jgi:hypothetical protein